MSPPPVALVALRSSTAALVRGIDAEDWADADVRAPSLLPNWTRAHVLTHIARNADSFTRAVSGALRGEIVRRYPDGQAGRTADIEAGATRALPELAADVRVSAQRLDEAFAAVAEVAGWELPTEEATVGEYVIARWREVEIHRVDLAGAYTADQWPADFVAYLLPEAATRQCGQATTPMQITVTAEGSLVPALAGQSWTVGDGDRIDVTGPDWAVLAWLVGRPGAAPGALADPPDWAPWR
jgi:maleylpyruvate isomerase